MERYRAAQVERVRRIDAVARERVDAARAARARFKASGDPADRRDALATEFITVFRTDADLRSVDLSIDPTTGPTARCSDPGPISPTTASSGSAG